MPIKIENKLTKDDFSTLVNSFQSHLIDSLVLFEGLQLDFIKITSLIMARKDSGYTLESEIFLKDPIGLMAWVGSKIDNEYLIAHSRRIKLQVNKPMLDVQEIENDIRACLELLEQVANYSCTWNDTLEDESFVLDSERLSKQLAFQEKRELMARRGEFVKPFATVHADGSKDAKKLGGDDLVPIYFDYDKWDLYGTKRVYRYLPRKFVMKLLKCNDANWVPEDQFGESEKEIIEDLVLRKYLKKTKVAGKTHYYGLNDKTRRHFLSMFRAKIKET